jgi:hypothetical protein
MNPATTLRVVPTIAYSATAQQRVTHSAYSTTERQTFSFTLVYYRTQQR